MPVDLNSLVPDFQQKVKQLVQQCAILGVEMRPYYALRSPFDQAKYWRQSRTREEIRQQITDFKEAGADFLAKCLESVGPQYGPHVTNALPGYSWHQWGEAVDCFWVVDSKAEWSTLKKVNGVNGYRVYAGEAAKMSLEAGGSWSGFKDWPHVQLRALGDPSGIYTLSQINDEMKRRFGN